MGLCNNNTDKWPALLLYLYHCMISLVWHSPTWYYFPPLNAIKFYCYFCNLSFNTFARRTKQLADNRNVFRGRKNLARHSLHRSDKDFNSQPVLCGCILPGTGINTRRDRVLKLNIWQALSAGLTSPFPPPGRFQSCPRNTLTCV